MYSASIYGMSTGCHEQRVDSWTGTHNWSWKVDHWRLVFNGKWKLRPRYLQWTICFQGTFANYLTQVPIMNFYNFLLSLKNIKISLFKKDLFIYLFIWERAQQKEREREKQTPRWAGSPMQGLIPGPWDHDLSQRQMLNRLSHPGASTKHLLHEHTWVP